MDSQVRGFGIRIMPTGVKTFILRRRYPGSAQPARRSLGSYGEMSLAEAREKAAEWNALVKKGIDPGAEEARQRKATVEAERNRKLNTFGSAFDNYLRRKASKLRSFRTIERELRRECAAWMDKPLSSISPIDVKQLVQDIAESGREAQAQAIFSRLRAFLNYVIDSGDFNRGLDLLHETRGLSCVSALPFLPGPSLQIIVDQNGDELAQCSSLSIGNTLKFSFRFAAHSHTYGVRTILHASSLIWRFSPATYTLELE